jgi:hypothetical protein
MRVAAGTYASADALGLLSTRSGAWMSASSKALDDIRNGRAPLKLTTSSIGLEIAAGPDMEIVLCRKPDMRECSRSTTTSLNDFASLTLRPRKQDCEPASGEASVFASGEAVGQCSKLTAGVHAAPDGLGAVREHAQYLRLGPATKARVCRAVENPSASEECVVTSSSGTLGPARLRSIEVLPQPAAPPQPQ